MSRKTVRVLLIEDSATQAKLLLELLAGGKSGFEIECTDTLRKGLECLPDGGFDVVLLDLSLPDAQGLDTLVGVSAQYPDLPIVVLTGLDDERTALEAVKLGAQDYIVKGQVQGSTLQRSIRHAIERKTAERRIRQLNEERERRIIELASANRALDELTRQLVKSRDQALEAANFKTQFVSKISHEIRSPVSAITGMAEILLSTPLGPEQREFVNVINNAAQSLEGSINSILDFTRMEAGLIELESIDFAPVSLVEDSVEQLAAAARDKGLSLMTFVEPRLPPLLTGDPVRLRQILVNLITNAVQCTTRGAVLVRAVLDAENDKSVTVNFSVTDTGTGLSPTAIKRIFEPVIQMHGSGLRSYGGPGLGLSICRRLVELMGGKLKVESEEGEGSTFSFAIPLGRSVNARSAGTSFIAACAAHLRDLRVLVAVDRDTARDILHKYVLAAGIGNGSAANADTAFELMMEAAVKGRPYDAVIVDFSRSSTTTADFARNVKGAPALAATKLILLREASQQDTVDERMFGSVLECPVRQAELIDVISRAVGKGPFPAAEQAPEPERAERKSERRPPVKGRVLVVEDEPSLQMLVLLQLKNLGFAAEVVGSGQEALEAIKRSDFSLILMDCQMPGMDGLATTRAIRAEESGSVKRIPIVAMTASTMPGDRENCLAAGMDEYLPKPVRREALRSVLEKWLSDGRRV